MRSRLRLPTTASSRVTFADEERDDGFPPRINVSLDHKVDLRYGENPHQNAALYRWSGVRGANLVNARQLCGKELSYNNYLDLDAALAMVRDYADPGCAVIKHNNPCGAAVDETLAGAAEKALEGDPISAFGGIVGFNRTLDVETAELLSAPGRFIEAIVAPDFEAAAVGVLTTKPKWRQSVRLVQVGKLDDDAPQHAFRFIHGGVLVQDPDSVTRRLPAWKVVTDAEPFEHVWPDVEFAVADRRPRSLECDRPLRRSFAVRSWGWSDESRGFGSPGDPKSRATRRRVRPRVGRFLSVSRLDRDGRGGWDSRDRAARRFEERRRSHRRLQPSGRADGLYRPATL